MCLGPNLALYSFVKCYCVHQRLPWVSAGERGEWEGPNPDVTLLERVRSPTLSTGELALTIVPDKEVYFGLGF